MTSVIIGNMDDPTPRTRWFHLTPSRFIAALPVIEALLWLSDRFGWWHKGYAVLAALAAVGVAMVLMLAWFGVAFILRRRFQFSLRSLLVLVVVVALPCSWLAVAIGAAKSQRHTVHSVQVAGGAVWYHDLEVCCSPYAPTSTDRPFVSANFMELDFFHSVAAISFIPVPDEEIVIHYVEPLRRQLVIRHDPVMSPELAAAIAAQHDLKFLSLAGTDCDDEYLTHFSELKQLETLDLRCTRVTAGGVRKLRGFLAKAQILWGWNGTKYRHPDLSRVLYGPHQEQGGIVADEQELRSLFLFSCDAWGSAIDSELIRLKNWRRLEYLDLHYTNLTDAGLEHLVGLTTLRHLDVRVTQVTADGVKKLQRALPKCKIDYEH
jgi:hypothetical protein